jgi:hypothetical protein
MDRNGFHFDVPSAVQSSVVRTAIDLKNEGVKISEWPRAPKHASSPILNAPLTSNVVSQV